MKKFLLTIVLAAALFVSGIKAETTYSDWIWLGTGWYYTGTSTNGDDPLPPPPPIED